MNDTANKEGNQITMSCS